MKRLLKLILRLLSSIIAFFLHPCIIKVISVRVTHIASEYARRQLKQCGNAPVFFFPITVQGPEYISIGNNFHACSRLRLEAYDHHLNNKYEPEIIIGNNVSIGYDCHIGCVNKIHIGHNVLIASRVFITDHFHGDTSIESLKLSPNARDVISKGAVIIQENVWIGEGAAIMPNVEIGKNSIIGANAVVTKNIPANSVAAGNPAKIIKYIE